MIIVVVVAVVLVRKAIKIKKVFKMKDYKRLTKPNRYFDTNDGEHNIILEIDEHRYEYPQYDYVDICEKLNRLVELENKIECGELVENKVVTYVNMGKSNSKKLIDKALKFDALKKKIENGTLVELPCKIGDTVFLMFKVNDNLYYGDYFVLDKIGFDKLGFYVETEKGIFRTHEIFLNKNEAAKKLKELQGNEYIKKNCES